MPLAKFSDLPTEILLAILEHPTISNETLYFLAFLSQRLNSIALAVYFSRIGLDLEAKSFTIPLHTDQDRPDLLSALQICLSVSSMQRVDCIFSHPGSNDILPFLKQMKRVENFFSRLASIKEVSLTFGPSSKGWCPAPGSDEVLGAWATQLRDLLNCIFASGCSSLTILQGPQLIDAYQLDSSAPPNYLPKPAGKVGMPPKTKKFGFFKFRRPPNQGTTDGLCSAIPRLSARLSDLNFLSIESAVLVTLPGLFWTLAALHQSSITTLRIRMSLIEPHIWSTVLPLLASVCPNLTTVSLTELDSPSGYHNTYSETLALAFLARFPRLAHVEMTHMCAIRSFEGGPWALKSFRGMTKGPTASLTHLTTLRAPANIVAHLLPSLPSVHSVCIFWISSSNLASLMRFMWRIVSTLAGRWRGSAPELTLWIEHLRSAYDDVRVLHGLTASQRKELARVERLHLENAILPAAKVGVSPRLFLTPVLGVFGGLKHVGVTTHHRDSVAQLVREVRATAMLKKIEVNGRTYDLASHSQEQP
ncbi:hypothetical protein K438DRAFT_1973994 [Mycena galopus ATCC 62051]|nr:hypothetical protein K438DRAFT_1973994 [Mycena galopus ATCC 62051]